MENATSPVSSPKNNTNMGLIVIALIVIVALGSVYFLTQKSSKESSKMAASPTSTNEQQVSPSVMMAGNYKDGTYAVEGDYTSPGGPEHLKVELTLKGGVVTDATVTPEATLPMSVHYQGIFADNYKPLVVGKKLDEIQLDKVSGSSLAPKGFNDAVSKIKAEAKS